MISFYTDQAAKWETVALKKETKVQIYTFSEEQIIHASGKSS